MKRKHLISLSLLLGLTGCNTNDYINEITSSDTSTSETNTSQSSITPIIFGSTTISIYKETCEIAPTTTEEAVEKVYDSVVVVNSYSMRSTGAGAGVLFAENDTYSFVLTCHHVIENATSFKVTTSDEKTYNATLVGGDDETDIAVLAIEKTGLNIARFVYDSDKIKIGSQAIAIGNPLGTLANTVTVGVVSAVSRYITTSDGTTRQLIQTDASINSGNSGGGLFNAAGELIGIVSSKYSSAEIEGLAFAIPANIACDIGSQLLEKGYVEGRFNLGATIKDGYISVGSWISAKQYLVVYISSLDPNGCAYGKLERDDIIRKIKIDYKDSSKQDLELNEVESASQANSFIKGANLVIGDKVIFTITTSSEYSDTSKDEEIEVEITQYIYTIQ